MKIGIAITTTPNRRYVCEKWYDTYRLLVSKIPLCIIEDNNYNGVVYSKNRCIENLYNNGCTHFFLFDDDCLIKDVSFIDRYINSGLNHACWNYNREVVRNPELKQYVELDKPNGCMLYATRKCIDIVGGFDTDFKGYGYEHVNWSDRIFNNGLTPSRYIDIPNSKGLFQMIECDSSFSYQDRLQIPNNLHLYQQKFYSKEFKPFK